MCWTSQASECLARHISLEKEGSGLLKAANWPGEGPCPKAANPYWAIVRPDFKSWNNHIIAWEFELRNVEIEELVSSGIPKKAFGDGRLELQGPQRKSDSRKETTTDNQHSSIPPPPSLPCFRFQMAFTFPGQFVCIFTVNTLSLPITWGDSSEDLFLATKVFNEHSRLKPRPSFPESSALFTISGLGMLPLCRF